MLIKSFINNLIKLKKNIILFVVECCTLQLSQSLITHKIKWNINKERKKEELIFLHVLLQLIFKFSYFNAIFILFIIKYINLIVFQIFFFKI